MSTESKDTTGQPLRSPSGAGVWSWRQNETSAWAQVLVEEGMASGRLCRQLRMGGSSQCGLAEWSGQWQRNNQ